MRHYRKKRSFKRSFKRKRKTARKKNRRLMRYGTARGGIRL